jgi:hypothetical protein
MVIVREHIQNADAPPKTSSQQDATQAELDRLENMISVLLGIVGLILFGLQITLDLTDPSPLTRLLLLVVPVVCVLLLATSMVRRRVIQLHRRREQQIRSSWRR